MTTNYDSVFDQPTVEWVSFKTIGEKAAGTFIDLEQTEDGYGNQQYVVTMLRDGVHLKYGVRLSHTWLVEQISKLKLGQIIGFTFLEERPSGKGQPTKVIVLRQNPAMIDENWMKTWIDVQGKLGTPAHLALVPNVFRNATSAADTAPVAPVAAPVTVTAPAEAAPVAAAVPEVATVAAAPVANPVFDTVRSLALSKGIVPVTATPAEIDAKIKELTGLEITDANVTPIIVAITALPTA